MPCLIWSPLALLDIQRIYHFLASKNIVAAKKALKAIRESAKIIALQPGGGRPAKHGPGISRVVDQFRDSGYIALYHYDGRTTAVIVAARHQKDPGY